ncbi:MAG: VanZ family protein [Candidatus Pacearchaeota archaeon]|nr:VanZ family protein [Candidatus Pacearchaeota archaeon]
MIKKERIFYIVMTVLVAAIIFYSSTVQATAGERTGLNLATLYHLGVFFMFTFFLSLSLKSEKIDLKTASIILLISLAYAISDEFHQLFVAGRFATVKDVLIDFAGSVSSLLVVKGTELFNKN